MTDQEILDSLKAIVAEIAGIDESSISLDKSFVDDLDISSAEVLATLIAGVGAGPEHVLAKAASAAVKDQLKDHVRQARERGLRKRARCDSGEGRRRGGQDQMSAMCIVHVSLRC